MNKIKERKPLDYETKYNRYKMYRLRTNYTHARISEIIGVPKNTLLNDGYSGRLTEQIKNGEVKVVAKTRSGAPLVVRNKMQHLRDIWKDLFEQLCDKYGRSIMAWDEKDPLLGQLRKVGERIEEIDPVKGNAHGIDG